MATLAVVDDNPLILELYVELAASLGHAAHPFADGWTFLDALAALRPDLVIVDRRMVGLDGFDVARRARRQDPELPILMISGSPAGEATAVDRFLAKPFTLTQFTEAVGALLGPERHTAAVSPVGAAR